MLGKRHQREEQFAFAGSELSETIEPEGGDGEGGGIEPLEGLGSDLQQGIAILEIVGAKPIQVQFVEQGEVAQFIGHAGVSGGLGGQRAELFRREAAILEFADLAAEFIGEAGAAGTVPKSGERLVGVREDRAEHHDASFFGEQAGDGEAGALQDEAGEARKREDVQAGVAGEATFLQELAFELKGGLFGSEKNQRGPFRAGEQFGADIGQTLVCLATAGGAKEEPNLHGGVFTGLAGRVQRKARMEAEVGFEKELSRTSAFGNISRCRIHP